MTQEMIRQLLDACFVAKKISETMPLLPKGIKPRHIHIITCVAERGKKGESVRVSDVSADLKVTMPSITKLVSELEELNVVEKSVLYDDKRVIMLSLTNLGMHYYDIYVTRYHGYLLQELADFDSTDCTTTISSINALYNAVSKIAQGGHQWK